MSELSELLEEAKRVGITYEQLERLKTRHQLRKAIDRAKRTKIFQASGAGQSE